MADIIQVDYDGLENVRKRLASFESEIQALHQRFRDKSAQLVQDGWEGENADAFSAEMEDVILPGLKQLSVGLSRSSQTLTEVARIFSQAEDGIVNDMRTSTGVGPFEGAQVMGGGGAGVASGESAGSQAGEEEGGFTFGRLSKFIQDFQHKAHVPHGVHAVLEGLTAYKHAKKLKLVDQVIKKLLPWSVPASRDLAPSVSDDAVNWLLRTHGKTDGILSKIMHNPIMKKIGVGLGVLNVGGNSLKLFEDLTDGNGLSADSAQTIGDLTFGSAGLAANTILHGTPAGWVLTAGEAGYFAGQGLDWLAEKVTGHAISDIGYALADEPDLRSTRDIIDDFIQVNATPKEKKQYFEWRREWYRKKRDVVKTGMLAPRYEIPDLPVLKGLDPKMVDMARRNVKLPIELGRAAIKGEKLPWWYANAYDDHMVPLFEQ